MLALAADPRVPALERLRYLCIVDSNMDEFFEILTLVQLRKLGSRFPVPVILCNFGGFYDGMLQFLASCHDLGTVGSVELSDVIVAADVDAVLEALAQFYGLPAPPPPPGADGATGRVLRASEWVEARGSAKQ